MEFFSAFGNENELPTDLLLPHSRPVWLKGKTKKAIVICLHGFIATVYEARPIAEALFLAGIDAACPLFPAHGLKDEKAAEKAMSEVKYEQWLECIRQEIAFARKQYEKVFIYGQSMGGIVALRMAEEGLVDACATTAPAIKLPTGVGFGVKILGWANLNVHLTFNPKFFNEAYTFNNLRAVKQLQQMALLVRKDLQKIKCPLLSCHSPDDEAVSPKHVPKWLQAQIPHALIKWFSGGHTMPLDVDAEKIKATIIEFFQSTL